ncbi:hypothetical protein ABW20_dc0101940 [Dactylellina cionopaga]|nr:hypothetical protein ABW20_dc0101940 [Dactylellina cionopaga]
MLFKSVFAALLLANTALASPLILPRSDCPAPTRTTTTVSLPPSTEYTILKTSTIWTTVHTDGRYTSTTTEKYTFTVTNTKTIYSPAVTTIPATTIYSTVTGTTSTSVWITLTLTSSVPGPPPTDPCIVTTCTTTILSAPTYTVTYDVGYSTGYTYITDHVFTKQQFFTKTDKKTETVIIPKSTKILSTVVVTKTYTPILITVSSVWKTVTTVPLPICT